MTDTQRLNWLLQDLYPSRIGDSADLELTTLDRNVGDDDVSDQRWYTLYVQVCREAIDKAIEEEKV